MENLNYRTMGRLLGGMVVLIAILLAIGQHYMIINFYGDISRKWYFWGLVGAIGLAGIVIAVWFSMRKEPAPEPVKGA